MKYLIASVSGFLLFASVASAQGLTLTPKFLGTIGKSASLVSIYQIEGITGTSTSAVIDKCILAVTKAGKVGISCDENLNSLNIGTVSKSELKNLMEVAGNANASLGGFNILPVKPATVEKHNAPPTKAEAKKKSPVRNNPLNTSKKR